MSKAEIEFIRRLRKEGGNPYTLLTSLEGLKEVEIERKKAHYEGVIRCLEAQIRNIDRLKVELQRVGEHERVTDILTGIQHQWKTDIKKTKRRGKK